MAPRRYRLSPADLRGLNRAQCKACGAPMLWYLDPHSGARVPIDERSASEATLLDALGTREFVSHFTTCPQADRFSHRAHTRKHERS